MSKDLTELDALLWMVLLHTHEIRLRPGAVSSSNGEPLSFAALTQRHAGEVMAGIWSDFYPDPGDRGNYAYWYRQYNTQTPYEVLEDVPAPLLPRLTELRAALSRDPRVAAVVPED
jgi:hypothetical protein